MARVPSMSTKMYITLKIQTGLLLALLFSSIMPAFAQTPAVSNSAVRNPATISPATGDATALQLHDIHLPEQVSNLPTAMGWWLSVVILMLILIVSIEKLKQYKALRKNQQRVILQLEKQMHAGNLTMENAMSLVKWSAMQYFPRDDIAALYQESFKRFLVAQLPNEHQAEFSELASDGFDNFYKAGFSSSVNASFNQAILLWVKKALPPKANTQRTTIENASYKNTNSETVNLGATTPSVEKQS